MPKPTRVALYAGVSTDKQPPENHLRELRQVADREGWGAVEEFVDHGISGSKEGLNNALDPKAEFTFLDE